MFIKFQLYIFILKCIYVCILLLLDQCSTLTLKYQSENELKYNSKIKFVFVVKKHRYIGMLYVYKLCVINIKLWILINMQMA